MWLYIDHGWRQMQWSTHCNTEVVRWTLRECGVTITGPDPKMLVAPVSPERLHARMRQDARTFLPDLLSWISFDIAWAQRYAVTTLCRIMHTFDEDRVTSKKAALLWAKDHLDPGWSGLIQQVLDDRRAAWLRGAVAASPLATLRAVDARGRFDSSQVRTCLLADKGDSTCALRADLRRRHGVASASVGDSRAARTAG